MSVVAFRSQDLSEDMFVSAVFTQLVAVGV